MRVSSLNVVGKLGKLRQAAARDHGASVVVGYNAAHAIHVHEMTPKNAGKRRRSGKGVYWGPSLYGSKFLEGPAREFAEDIGALIVLAYQRGRNLLKALWVGGLRLQRESQMRVPVEHGFLRKSAFCEEE